MKKKIAFIYDHIEIGGAGKVFLNILSSIDYLQYDVTVFSVTIDPAYRAQFPPQVTVTELPCPDSRNILQDDLKHLRLYRVLKAIYMRFLIRQQEHEFDKLLLAQRLYPHIPGTYDCAIAFVSNYQSVAVLMGRVAAAKKATWIHIALENSTNDTLFYQRMVSLDRIFCVSQLSKNRLDTLCPVLKNKTQVLYNLVDIPQILESAEQPIQETLMHTSLVTVGRLSPEKGQDMIPSITRSLLDNGHDVYWYLVGDGSLRPHIEEEIRREGVEDRVILLGTKTNPYPYIKNCDIYVQTSHTEGWCLTTQEAKILCKPIITTDLPVMHEQFENRKTGIIADADTPEALAQELSKLLDQPELQGKLRQNLQSYKNSHTGDLQPLSDFITS